MIVKRPFSEAVDAVKADRRALSPADSMNAITIGAWHRDASTEAFGVSVPLRIEIGAGID
jgi:hypothetical protein